MNSALILKIKQSESKPMQQNMVNSSIWRRFLMIKKASKTVSGWKVGQVKEICYRSLGDGHLAKPFQVTAEIEAGKAGVIDIDRESWPGSPIQDRGIRILSDYLKANFVSCQRVGIRTRIFFEQSCGNLPVDKASSAELYALLSRIANIYRCKDSSLVRRRGILSEKFISRKRTNHGQLRYLFFL
jgi:hypothetical protein